MEKIITALTLTAMGAFGASNASAGAAIHIGLPFFTCAASCPPPVCVAPAPVVVQSAPVYVQPTPVYAQSAPTVIYAPAPAVYAAPRVFVSAPVFSFGFGFGGHPVRHSHRR